MSLLPVKMQPGLYTEASPRDDVGRYKDGNNVRFHKGNPQKFGGCAVQIETYIAGICRSMLSWTTTSSQRLIGLGTSSKLYLSDSLAYFDITPLRKTVNPMANNPFAVVNGSATVAVTDVAHGAAVGDHVTYSGATVFGGLAFDGDHVITVVPDDDHYQFQASANAVATGSGGGAAVVALYDITSGNINSVLGAGWGAGGWGTGTWGTPRISGFLQLARIWSLANWGEDFVASPIDRPVYIWLASSGTNTRAVLITQAPAQNRRVLISDQIRIMISFGSHDGVNADPMLIRWCDSEDYTDWTPSPTNLAGDKRLDRGSEIITAVLTRGEFAVFTDTTLYAMALTGDNNVFSFDPKGATVGLVGPNAACDVNGVVYAMGWGQFYTYDGQIKPLPCDLHSRIFGTPTTPGFNISQAAKIHLRRNKQKSEILIFYPSVNSIEIDSVAGYNFDEGTWWIGDRARTAWIDDNTFFAVPLATRVPADAVASGNSQMMLQETGVDEADQPMPYFLKTFDMEVGATSNVLTGSGTGAGELVHKITSIWPDMIRIVGRHKVTLNGKKYPMQRRYKTKGPRTLSPGQRRVDIHMRCRQINITLESDQLGADIEIGAWRASDAIMGSK